MGNYEHLRVTVHDRVAQVVMSRPERLNTLHPPAHAEMERIWPDLDEREDVAAVVLSGEGTVFSAGGDAKDMFERLRRDPNGGSGISTASARRLVTSILDFEKPLVAAVEGRAHGLGATLALLCDFLVVAQDATFSDPHVDIGLVPGDGGAAIWTVVAGPHRAKQLLLRSTTIDCATVTNLGLVTEVATPGRALDVALELARELADGPPLATRGTKISINAWLKSQFVSIFETSLAREEVTLRSPEFVERLHARRAHKHSPTPAP